MVKKDHDDDVKQDINVNKVRHIFFNPHEYPVVVHDVMGTESIPPGDIVEGERYNKAVGPRGLVRFTPEIAVSYALRAKVGARHLIRTKPYLFTDEQRKLVESGNVAKFKDLTVDQWFKAFEKPNQPPVSDLTRAELVQLCRFLGIEVNDSATPDEIYTTVLNTYNKYISISQDIFTTAGIGTITR